MSMKDLENAILLVMAYILMWSIVGFVCWKLHRIVELLEELVG